MPGVLAWIVAVECHSPQAGVPSPLDFPIAVAARALDWADWLLQHRPGVRLLLNVAVAPGSENATRVAKLARQPQVLNAASADRADAAALHLSLQQVVQPAGQPPVADTLLLLWLGHGVMLGRQRFLLHQGARDLQFMLSWEVDGLLQRLRSDSVPPLQIGVIDTCAQVVGLLPTYENLTGEGQAACNQFYYFAASSAQLATLSDFEPTLTGLALQALQAAPWADAEGPQRAALDAHLQAGMAQLASRPFVWEWTQGSGDRFSAGSGGSGGTGGPARTDRADPARSLADTAADATAAQLLQLARDSSLHPGLLAHLHNAAQGLPISLRSLVLAYKRGTVDALVARHEKRHAEPAQGLAEAWARVQSVERWHPPAARLGLSLAQWEDLAKRLAHEDVRNEPPRFTELPPLLLWATDMGGIDVARGVPRSAVALARLLWQALQQRSGLDATAAAAARQALLQQLQQHSVLGPLVAALQTLQQADAPPLLIVDLEPAPGGRSARIKQHWVHSGGRIERGPALPPAGRLGEDLGLLIGRAQQGSRQPVRVELLATRALLWGQFEWRGYTLRMGRDRTWVALDQVNPIWWRWKERLCGEQAERLQALWTPRALAVRARAQASAGLRCRFDDDAAAADDAHVLALGYAPKANTSAFFQALTRGEPYMLWPSEAPVDGAAFRQMLCQWLAAQPLGRLPEALCQALAGPAFPRLVLFIDEPERNPYALMQAYETVLPA